MKIRLFVWTLYICIIAMGAIFETFANDATGVISQLIKISSAKAAGRDGWEVFIQYCTSNSNYRLDHVTTPQMKTDKDGNPEPGEVDEYVNLLHSTKNRRRLVNAVFESSLKVKADTIETTSLINALADAKIKKVMIGNVDGYFKYDFTIFGLSQIRGIMLCFYRKGSPKFAVIAAQDNEIMRQIHGNPDVYIARFNYADNGKVDSTDLIVIERNDKINSEIEKLWEKLDIGVWAREYPYKFGRYVFMPMGMKENMYSIEEFAVVKLKAKLLSSNTVIAERYTTPIEELKKIKSARALSLAEEQKLNDLQTRYVSIILPDLRRIEEKLKYFEKKLEEKRE